MKTKVRINLSNTALSQKTYLSSASKFILSMITCFAVTLNTRVVWACQATGFATVSLGEAETRNSSNQEFFKGFPKVDYKAYGQRARDTIHNAVNDSGAGIQQCWMDHYSSFVRRSSTSVCAAENVVATNSGVENLIDKAKPAVLDSFSDAQTGLVRCQGQLSNPTCEKTFNEAKSNVESEKQNVFEEYCGMADQNGKCNRPQAAGKTPEVAQSEVDQEAEQIIKELEEIRDRCVSEAAAVTEKFTTSMRQNYEIAESMGFSKSDISAMMTKAGIKTDLAGQIAAPQTTGGKILDWMKENPGKTALGAAALGAGGMYMLKDGKDKDDDDKDKDKNKNTETDKTAEQREKEFQAGYAYNAAGERINCQTQEHFKSDECKPVLLNFCGQSQYAGNNSCAAFNAHYCAQNNSSQSFCIQHAAKMHCNQTGPFVSQNPACVWLSARPENCKRTPESRACLLNWPKNKLAEECPKYPTDPLCLAHNEGKEVVQEGSQLANVTPQGAPAGLAGLMGQRNPAGQVNLFGVNSNTLNELCRTRQLINCQ